MLPGNKRTTFKMRLDKSALHNGVRIAASEYLSMYIEWLIKNHFNYDKVPHLWEMLNSEDNETRKMAKEIINNFINENK